VAGGRWATGPGSAEIRDHEAVWDRLREELSGRGHEVTATWLGTTAPQRAGCRRTYKWPGCVEVLVGLGHGATVMRPRGLETTGPWDTGPRGHGATWPRGPVATVTGRLPPDVASDRAAASVAIPMVAGRP